MTTKQSLADKLPEKNTCAECTVNRVKNRGILAINCVVEADSEWFCGFPCLLDYFNRIDGKVASASTQLLKQYGIKPDTKLHIDES